MKSIDITGNSLEMVRVWVRTPFARPNFFEIPGDGQSNLNFFVLIGFYHKCKSLGKNPQIDLKNPKPGNSSTKKVLNFQKKTVLMYRLGFTLPFTHTRNILNCEF
ncbi:MAG: hypothetical protein CM15mP117_10200 [Alphaproteobacteria bacterium]|nr:MAG: hypothetical protein CM15mP117_10200 [Alphaproteobacteria bacterium]